jgi:ribosome-associated translation inhibitor RaiA
MEIPLQITLRNLPSSEALEARIREGAVKLELFHPRITSCRVTVEQAERHHHQGRQFGVHIDVRGPGHEEVVSTLKHDEDVYVAMREAFDATRRQLEDVVRQARDDVAS